MVEKKVVDSAAPAADKSGKKFIETIHTPKEKEGIDSVSPNLLITPSI